MENGEDIPKPQHLTWQDITIETVHEMVSENELTQARLAATMRIEMLQQVCEDTDDAIAKNEGEITIQEWQTEKGHMQREIAELQKIIQTIDTDTHDE